METRKAILVADDEAAIRHSIRDILDEEGYEVLMAADGNEALRLSHAHDGVIDLLVTDVEMPRVDGVTASKRFLSDRPDAKVLFISGSTKLPELSGQLHFLRKPFSLDELLAKVHKILQDAAIKERTSTAIILVVDHDRERLKRSSNILSGNGYLVLKASSVEEAEAISDVATRIDLIVSEVLFSGNSGVHLAEREAAHRNIDTLLISHVSSDLLNEVPGFADHAEFLANPFTPEDLLDRVRRLLDVSQVRRQEAPVQSQNTLSEFFSSPQARRTRVTIGSKLP